MLKERIVTVFRRGHVEGPHILVLGLKDALAHHVANLEINKVCFFCFEHEILVRVRAVAVCLARPFLLVFGIRLKLKHCIPGLERGHLLFVEILTQ